MGTRHRNIAAIGMRQCKRSLLHRVELALLACERRKPSKGQLDLARAVLALLDVVVSQTVRSQGGMKRERFR